MTSKRLQQLGFYRRFLTPAIFILGAASLFAGTPNISPTSPASLQINVGEGEVQFPGGKRISVTPATVSIDGPEIRSFEAKANGKAPMAPINYGKYFEEWEPWPKSVSLTPKVDESGKTMIMGAFYRYWRPETLIVRSADGQIKKEGVDFMFNPDWGQIANLKSGLGAPGKQAVQASIEAALPRLDLLQVDEQGKVSVKKGETRMVCPATPQPDAGKVALAGIYVAPWRSSNNPNHAKESESIKGASEYAVTNTEIFPIQEVSPVAPVNASAIAGFAGKLEEGKNVSIAFMGDSITLGAEATAWFVEAVAYSPNDKTYRGKLVNGLKQKFPKATINPVAAYKGGKTVEYGVEIYKELVEPSKPDLVVIAFGGNDVDGPAKGAPRSTPEKFQENIEKIVDLAKSQGADVMLVSCFPLNPWMKNGMAQRQPDYNKKLVEIAEKKGCALAPVFDVFQRRLPASGSPVYNTLHNWKNHPGDAGHELYAQTLLQTISQAK